MFIIYEYLKKCQQCQHCFFLKSILLKILLIWENNDFTIVHNPRDNDIMVVSFIEIVWAFYFSRDEILSSTNLGLSDSYSSAKTLDWFVLFSLHLAPILIIQRNQRLLRLSLLTNQFVKSIELFYTVQWTRFTHTTSYVPMYFHKSAYPPPKTSWLYFREVLREQYNCM